MPKILVDCERMRYPKSGIAMVCRSLIHGLSQLNTDLDITFYGPSQHIAAEKNKIIECQLFHKVFPPSHGKFKLLHVMHQLSDYFHQKNEGQKKLVTLHDLNFLHEDLPPEKIQKRIKLVQKNIGNADAIVCISEFAKSDFCKNIDLFHLKDHVEISVIHNGLIFPQMQQYQSEKLKFLEGKAFVLNIGVMFPKKNQLVLLDFLSKTDLDLVLVSANAKNDYEKVLMQKIKDLNLENRVHIIKNADENDKNYLLQQCESYVHPSLAEGFGIPPLEAMFFGKPVFLSTYTSLPEIGRDAAFFFHSFNAEEMRHTYQEGMLKFRNNKDEFRKNVQQHALSFDSIRMAAEYLKVYHSLMD